ncbi:MAG: VCBS repeat-containing protein [Bacteroidota bacterium]
MLQSIQTKIYIIIVVGVMVVACENEPQQSSFLFQQLSPKHTNIDFINELRQTEEFNTYTFRNFYNGAGVALGDINNDGLTDIYFAGNSVDNRLYLNQGDFQFEDVTRKAGVACKDVWSTGVSMADINGDGWLDIYVCKSGPPGGPNRYNELFINQQDGTFKEEAKNWGIADEGLSVHAVFFDYDKDGDLDAYLLNNSLRSIGTGSDLQKSNRDIRDPNGGNKLYRNEGNRFVDVSEAAGIYGSEIGFGLGVTIGDVNRDGWQDIYVSNDFFEKDYLYINQQDGTFHEAIEEQIREISMGSMGADMADLTNDGYPEIFVTEMLPERNDRYKTKAQFEGWETYQRKLESGYFQQFGRNVLQLNNANGSFSEIGRMTNVEASDWSWGALIFDMNADGYKDLFVANGIYKDLLDQDYVNFYSSPERVRELMQTEESAILTMIDAMPSEALPNYAFIQHQDTSGIPQFQNLADSLGLAEPSFSNGSAYGDLDNDGDLDLVVNNVNMPPFIYRNQSKERLGHHTLSIKLKGEAPNTFGLGAQVMLYADEQIFYQELAPMRGFQSSVEPCLHFGLGQIEVIDSIVVIWNSLKVSRLSNVDVDQVLTVEEASASKANDLVNQMDSETWFSSTSKSFPFAHRENTFSDFNRDRLLFQMLSNEGPKIAKADVNGDGLEDLYFCGAKDQAGSLFLQQMNGQFRLSPQSTFEADAISEDTDAVFFDADGDGDQDLYVASGGNEFPTSSSALRDRLYRNNGRGQFERDPQTLPTFQFESSGCVAAADYDQDGDIDLAVGIRLRPFLYGVPMNIYLLENNGTGKFKNVSQQRAPELKGLGLITDLAWLDVDRDDDDDLVVSGEWMPLQVFENKSGQLTRKPAAFGELTGFWHCMEAADIDQDGDLDIIVGNMGRNTRLEASTTFPLKLYINDFDQNGSVEQILTQTCDGKDYPWTLRNDLITQLPHLKKKYLKFENYQSQAITDIFTAAELQNTLILNINTLDHTLFLNRGDGTFEAQSLPLAAQLSPIYALELADFNGDDQTDLLLGGNFYRSKPEMGIYDASYTTLLQGNGKGSFQFVPNVESGLTIKGEIRDFEVLEDGRVLVARNDEKALIVSLVE